EPAPNAEPSSAAYAYWPTAVEWSPNASALFPIAVDCTAGAPLPPAGVTLASGPQANESVPVPASAPPVVPSSSRHSLCAEAGCHAAASTTPMTSVDACSINARSFGARNQEQIIVFPSFHTIRGGRSGDSVPPPRE